MAALLHRGTSAASLKLRWRAARPGPLPPLAAADEPRAESLRDVTARLLPYWYGSIVPDLRTGECVLVVSHGNTLRALIKYLDAIGDDEIAGLEIPNGVPLFYQLDPGLRPVTKGGRRLAG
jgi:2,3-bisphosphoglycerate-dependent phosphoglycerate mutase